MDCENDKGCSCVGQGPYVVEAKAFVRTYWKSTLLFILLGVIVASIYLANTKPTYEASSLIEAAKSYESKKAELSDSTSILIARLQSPSSYTVAAKKACLPTGLETESGEDMVHFAKLVKLESLAGTQSVIKVTVRGESPEKVEGCLGAIFQMIYDQQNEAEGKILSLRMEQLAKLRQELAMSNKLFSTLERRSPYSVEQLVARGYYQYLNSKALDLEIAIGLSNSARLVSPIHCKNRPVSPKSAWILLAGIVAGCLIGVAVNLLRCTLVSRKMDIVARRDADHGDRK